MSATQHANNDHDDENYRSEVQQVARQDEQTGRIEPKRIERKGEHLSKSA